MNAILAAIDFSPVTKRVVAEAIALARAANARVILLNVTTPQTLVQDYAKLEAVLEAAEPLPKAGSVGGMTPPIHGNSLQIIGDAVDVILAQAKSNSADFIVIGSHGHTALFELLVGGTTEGVIRGAKCPVMVVPSAPAKNRKDRPRSSRRTAAGAWRRREGARPVGAGRRDASAKA